MSRLGAGSFACNQYKFHFACSQLAWQCYQPTTSTAPTHGTLFQPSTSPLLLILSQEIDKSEYWGPANADHEAPHRDSRRIATIIEHTADKRSHRQWIWRSFWWRQMRAVYGMTSMCHRKAPLSSQGTLTQSVPRPLQIETAEKLPWTGPNCLHHRAVEHWRSDTLHCSPLNPAYQT